MVGGKGSGPIGLMGTFVGDAGLSEMLQEDGQLPHPYWVGGKSQVGQPRGGTSGDWPALPLIKVVGAHLGWDWPRGGAAGGWLVGPTPYWSKGINQGVDCPGGVAAV